MRPGGVMKYYLVYITAPSLPDAQTLCKSLVEERLAACANILPGVKSIYHWQGNVEESDECVCILKTPENLYPDLEERARQLHPYEVPCIVAVSIKEGSKDFLGWIAEETLH